MRNKLPNMAKSNSSAPRIVRGRFSGVYVLKVACIMYTGVTGPVTACPYVCLLIIIMSKSGEGLANRGHLGCGCSAFCVHNH